MIFLLSTPRIEACELLQASFSLSKLPWQGNEQVDSALAYLWELHYKRALMEPIIRRISLPYAPGASWLFSL